MIQRSKDKGTVAPLQLDYAKPPPLPPVRPLALIGIGIAGVLAAAFVGTSTNAINGAVSPVYFIDIMGWQGVGNVWLASVVQGVLEGSIVGVLFSIILVTTIAIVTRGTCTLGLGLRWIGRVILAIYIAWLAGGICGLGWVAVSPLSFQNSSFGYSGDGEEMVRFAWVRGSIWGAEPGGLLVVIIMLVGFGLSWRREMERESGGSLPASLHERDE